MKNLKSLGKILTKNEQKNLLGGLEEEGGGANSGICIGSVGCWHYYSTVPYSVCVADIQTYCSSGHGWCSQWDQCG